MSRQWGCISKSGAQANAIPEYKNRYHIITYITIATPGLSRPNYFLFLDDHFASGFVPLRRMRHDSRLRKCILCRLETLWEKEVGTSAI